MLIMCEELQYLLCVCAHVRACTCVCTCVGEHPHWKYEGGNLRMTNVIIVR